MNTTNKETWNDGQLRSVQLVMNGFPDNNTPALPDELFLENNQGERVVEILKTNDQWETRVHPKTGYVYGSFQEAFEKGLALARMEIEQ